MIYKRPDPGEMALAYTGDIFMIVHPHERTEQVFRITSGHIYTMENLLCLAGIKTKVGRQEAVAHYENEGLVFECEGEAHPRLPDTWIIHKAKGLWA